METENGSVSDHGQSGGYGLDLPTIPGTNSGLLHDETNPEVPVPGRDQSPRTELDFYERKWKRMRKDYSDEYLHVFRSSCESINDEGESSDLTETQIRGVVWQPEEKSRLFHALPRYGLGNLQLVARVIETKSEFEVRDFVDQIKQAETDRQMFEAQTKNVAHSDIPAAVEIGEECERTLNTAAEALAAFQERYDYAVARNAGRLWLIDSETASQLDEQHDKNEANGDNSEAEEPAHDMGEAEAVHARSIAFFHLGTMLKLSEEVFMNQPNAINIDHWRLVGEDDQRPGIMLDATVEIFDVLVNLTRRIVQTTIFLAKSRLRSTTRHVYEPSRQIHRTDVEAALDVLDLQADSWEFWRSLPRRAGFKVVDGQHRKGKTRKRSLLSDDVDGFLSERSRSSRSRSASVSTSASHDIEEVSDLASATSSIEGIQADSDEIQADSDAAYAPSLDEDDSKVDEEMAYSSTDGRDSISDDDYSGSLPAPIRYRSQIQRRQELEEKDDVYLENLDQLSRQQEEGRLLQMLRKEHEPHVKVEEVDDLGPRPKVLRKIFEDLNPWSCIFQAQWERDGKAITDSAFDEPPKSSKRQKLNVEQQTTELMTSRWDTAISQGQR